MKRQNGYKNTEYRQSELSITTDILYVLYIRNLELLKPKYYKNTKSLADPEVPIKQTEQTSNQIRKAY